MSKFQQLIGGMSRQEFFENYYEKKCLHLKQRGEDFYKDVLTTNEISDYLDRDDIFYPAIRMVKAGKELPISNYTKNEVPIGHQRKNGLVDTERMMHYFNNNATIVIQAGQRYFEGVATTTLNISEEFNAPVQANLYITPTRSQGFNPHWDTHDVLVLQIEGTKTWHLYDFEKYLPTKAQPYKGQKITVTQSETIQLQPGDLLYIPRGYVHDAVADEGVSAHITIGILAYTWERFFRDAVLQLKDYEDFRTALPLGDKNFATILQEKLDAFQQKLPGLNYETVKNGLQRSHHNLQAQPFREYFNSLVKLNEICPDSLLERNENIFYQLESNKVNCRLSFKGKNILMPVDVKESFDHILSSKTFFVKDLPGNLTDNGKLVLVKKLVKEGFLHLAADETK